MSLRKSPHYIHPLDTSHWLQIPDRTQVSCPSFLSQQASRLANKRIVPWLLHYICSQTKCLHCGPDVRNAGEPALLTLPQSIGSQMYWGRAHTNATSFESSTQWLRVVCVLLNFIIPADRLMLLCWG